MPAKFSLACSMHDMAHVHDLLVNIRGRFSRPPGLTGSPVLESIPDSKVVTGTHRTPQWPCCFFKCSQPGVQLSTSAKRILSLGTGLIPTVLSRSRHMEVLINWSRNCRFVPVLFCFFICFKNVNFCFSIGCVDSGISGCDPKPSDEGHQVSESDGQQLASLGTAFIPTLARDCCTSAKDIRLAVKDLSLRIFLDECLSTRNG